MLYVLGRALDFLSKVKAVCYQKYYTKYYSSILNEKITINGKVQIYSTDNLSVEGNVHIGGGAFIKAEGGVLIGENTHISRNVVIYSCNHEYEGDYLPYDNQLRLRPVKIGRNVWVGMNVTILPGSEIGDGAIIGAGSVVAGTIDEMEIFGASRAVKLSVRDKGHYQYLDSNSRYSGSNGNKL